jgi:hypothetical protein
MTGSRYNRWQGLAIAQFSVAVALISALSVAGISAGMSLLQNKEFMHELPCKGALAGALLSFAIAAACSCIAVVTRTLDFRLTARKVRQDRNPGSMRPLTIFGLDAEACGRASWFLFWVSLLSFGVGGLLLATSIVVTYAKHF